MSYKVFSAIVPREFQPTVHVVDRELTRHGLPQTRCRHRHLTLFAPHLVAKDEELDPLRACIGEASQNLGVHDARVAGLKAVDDRGATHLVLELRGSQFTASLGELRKRLRENHWPAEVPDVTPHITIANSKGADPQKFERFVRSAMEWNLPRSVSFGTIALFVRNQERGTYRPTSPFTLVRL